MVILRRSRDTQKCSSSYNSGVTEAINAVETADTALPKLRGSLRPIFWQHLARTIYHSNVLRTPPQVCYTVIPWELFVNADTFHQPK